MREERSETGAADAAVLPSTALGRWFVAAILALALLLRVFVVMESRSEFALIAESDALHFDKIATSIRNGEGFGNHSVYPAVGASAFRAPGYPVFLSAIYAVFGEHNVTMARLANAVLGTGVVALLGIVAAQLLNRRVAAVAMVLAAAHPAMVLVGSSLQLEPLLVVLCLGALAATLQYRREPRGYRWPLVAGVLLGLAVSTREFGLLALPSLALLLWSARAPGVGGWCRAAVTAPLVLVTSCVLVLTPWTVRNAVTFGALVPVSTSAGIGLAGTYNETSMRHEDAPTRWIPPSWDPQIADILANLDEPTEIEVDRTMRSVAVQVVRDHPTYPARVAFWNNVRLFELDGGEYSLYLAPFMPYSLRLTRLSIVAGYVVLASAIIGSRQRATRRVPGAVWLTPVLIYAFMMVFLPASMRYRASLEPYFVLLASVAVVAGAERFGWWPMRGGDQPAAPEASEGKALAGVAETSSGQSPRSAGPELTVNVGARDGVPDAHRGARG